MPRAFIAAGIVADARGEEFGDIDSVHGTVQGYRSMLE